MAFVFYNKTNQSECKTCSASGDGALLHAPVALAGRDGAPQSAIPAGRIALGNAGGDRVISDRELIDRLHEVDMQASKARDYRTLRTLLSDDVVVLPPGGRMIQGRDAIDQSFAKMGDVDLPSEVLEYRFDWREVRIVGEYAYEWGYIHGSERNRATGELTTSMYHVMRILQKQADGDWKVHRTIWNEPGK